MVYKKFKESMSKKEEEEAAAKEDEESEEEPVNICATKSSDPPEQALGV
jgi:hypothetical protein